jgi:integrase
MALLCWWYCLKYSCFSFDGFLSAITLRFAVYGRAWREGPLLADARTLCKKLFSGVDKPVAKDAISTQEVATICASLALPLSHASTTFQALLLVSFWGMLRENESAALCRLDVRIFRDRAIVTVVFSKTMCVPHDIILFRRVDGICPVRALEALLALHPKFPPSAPLFTLVSGKGLSGPAADIQFKKVAASVLGRDPHTLSLHSLRRSGATALLNAGVPPVVISHMGRWLSDTAFKKYALVQAEAIKLAYATVAATVATVLSPKR